MNTIKYDYRRLGKHLFRIRLERCDDICFGVRVRYEIQAPADIPHHWWERFIQFFTVECYHFGYWTASMANDTLEQRITEAMTFVVNDLDIQNNAEKEWAAL